MKATSTEAQTAKQTNKSPPSFTARRDPERHRENSCTLFRDYYIMKGCALSMKTQEEMCVLIQSGERQDLIPALWESVANFYTKKAYRYYNSHRERCAACGVELEDIQQQAYFAFLKSIDEYKPEAGLRFLAYIKLPFLTAMQELLCYRSGRSDTLNICDSLDRELDTGDGDGGSTLHDLIADEHSIEFIQQLDADSVAEMVRAEVRKLPDRERQVIEGSYFAGLTLGEIGQQLGICQQRAAQIKNAALRRLARSRNLVELHNAFYHSEKLRKLERESRHSFEAAIKYDEVAAQIQKHIDERSALLLWMSGAAMQQSSTE